MVRKMKKSVVLLCIIIVLGGFYFDRGKAPHQKQIQQVDINECQRLMIVAHPDDETIWGGSHLLKGHYLVVCLTNGKNKVRKKEFMKVMKQTHNQGLMFDYPDKTKGKRDSWLHVQQKIKKDISYLVHKKDWEMVITHNPLGEYGHIHHRITSQIVSLQTSRENLYYFGKYYKRKKVPPYLNSITKDDAKEKRKLTNIYSSQKKVMKHLNHMMLHENWVKAKDWRSL